MKRLQTSVALVVLLCFLTLLAPSAPAAAATDAADTHIITLSSSAQADGSYSHSATLDGETVSEYDYTWHADPSEVHDDVKNAPAEYYTGTEPGDDAVYIAHDIYYYPELDADHFVKVNYDGEQEWAYYYTAEGYEDYIFGTLPASGSSVPTSMMHTADEAYDNAVLHITEPGTYILEGEWHGQIWIDLGDSDDTFTDENAKATVILNGVDVTCTVAPALVFYSAYECDNTWEDQSSWSHNVDTTDAGANVIIADGSENNFSGENVYRMLKTTYKDSDSQSNGSVPVQKKRLKIDGAFYSYVSMNIDGEEAGTGVLNITGGYEGLDSELHLTLNGGHVNIFSQDDGINVNEDGVSVVTVNGGDLHILAGLGNEGDGIDSNGFLVINGGNVVTMANPAADSGLDSDFGSYINGGTVVALGSTMDWAEADDSSDAGQATMNLQFASAQSADEAIILTDSDGNVVFAYDPDKDEVAGDNARQYQGAIISCDQLNIGSTYRVYVGGDVDGDESAGIYDADSVTGFSDDAVLQCYTGTSVGMGGPGGGRPEDGFDPGQMPDGDFQPGQRPEGTPPEGDFQPGQGPEGTPPEGDFQPGQPGEGFDPGQMGGGPAGDFNQTDANATASIYFTLTDTVNDFSGVSDYDENTVIFSDVSSDDWYADVVRDVYERGLMTGVSDTTFGVNDTTTRAMLMAILARLDGAELSTSDPWYQASVDWAVANGISDGTQPESSITREQLVTMLWRAAGCPATDVDLSSYSDAASISSWANDAMQWGVSTGLICGNTVTTLNPTGNATRAEMAAILARYCTAIAE